MIVIILLPGKKAAKYLFGSVLVLMFSQPKRPSKLLKFIKITKKCLGCWTTLLLLHNSWQIL